jgi:O-antigen/teichoic acid export membrane protein
MRRRLVLSVFDQGVVSAFNFALNLFLIKLWSAENFGVFSIIAAASLFTTMLQNALINTPLAVHFPSAPTLIEQALLRRVFSAANLVLTIIVLILSLIGLMYWLGAAKLALALCASFYVTTQFVREYYRALLAVEGRLASLLLADISYVGLVIIVLVYLHWSGDTSMQTMTVFFSVLSSLSLLTILRFTIPEKWPSLTHLPKEIVSVFTQQMHEIRWSLLGALTTDIQNRGYIYIAAVFFGPITVAHLQAGRIFFGPLNLLTSAWSRVARPQLAGLIGQGNQSQFNMLLNRALWAFVAFNILFLAALWLAWPYLSAFVFGDKYKGLGFMVAGWGVANFVFQIRSCLSIGVQALRHFRSLTLATIYGAILSTVIVAVACFVHEPMWMIASVIGGECVAILVVLRILRRYLPKEDHAI